MPVTSTALIAASAKALTPIFNDLYAYAKGSIQQELKKLTTSSGVRKIARGLLKIESVKTIWSPEKELSVLEFYYPSRISKGSDEVQVKEIQELPGHNVVVQGIVGQGKSIFMRYLASAAIRDECSSIVPVFFELRKLTARKGLVQSIYKYLEQLGFSVDDKIFDYLASSGKICLLLDGFDEIPSDCIKETLDEIEFLQAKFPEMRIIVSSRPGSEIQKVTGFAVVDLAHLNDNDYEPFLKRLKIPVAKRQDLIKAISSNASNVGGLVETPLMLTLVVMVYESEREIPPTLPEFFEKLFHVVFTRHDRLKLGFDREHHSGLSERKLQELFEAFCFMAIELQHGRSMSREEFNETFDLAQDYTTDCKCSVEKFRKDIVKVACLMMEEGVDTATFLHKSIMEYYAASFIRRSSDEVAKMFYHDAATDNYRGWVHVLRYLESIDAYRYSRNYILNGGPEFLKSLQDLVSRKNDGELIDFVMSVYPEMSVGFELNGEPQTFGPMGPLDNQWHSFMDPFLTRAVISMFKNTDQHKIIAGHLNGAQGVAVHYGDGLRDLSYRDVARLVGVEAVWAQVNVAENELFKAVEKARGVVQEQEKRKKIFNRKSREEKLLDA